MAASQQGDGPSGTGEAAAGLVNAVVGADGLLEKLTLNPRALRSGSQELAEHIVVAVRAAQRHRLSQIDKADGDDSAIDDAGLDALLQRLDDLEAQANVDFMRLTSALDDTLRRIEESNSDGR
ncbi:YbaB/EbfC family nucleoid-associated protein [Streptosporangium sp. NPDC000396]|uniref:YbaB/EbfC family nucleoid-associated protein n=1 Tax=Streptosporangium sp. NPDC000396 TaxID=3366185 RepID=UPI0036A523A5